MGKKILVLNGSPRTGGNTEMLVNSFIEGTKQSENEVFKFDLQKMNIQPCLGCLKGGKDKESPCVQKDDMNKIYKAFTEADTVVFASPLYFWSFTAQLKIAIDRIFALMEAGGSYKDKECAMIIAAEEDSKNNFAPMVSYYETLVNNLGWKNKGMVLAGGVYKVGDIKDKPSLEEARKLGTAI